SRSAAFLVRAARGGHNRAMTEGASQRPGGPGRRRATLLQLELPCETLDEVRAKHPELRSRRFHLRTDQPKPLDSVLLIDVRLAGGGPCCRASRVGERAQGEPDPGMPLCRLAADDAGRELIAWRGGAPPPPLRDATQGEAPEMPRAGGGARPAGRRDEAGQRPAEPPEDGSELVDPFAAFEAAAAAVDRMVEEPGSPEPAPAGTVWDVVNAPPLPAPPPARIAPPPPPPPLPAGKRLGAVQLVTRAVPVKPLPPEPALEAFEEPTPELQPSDFEAPAHEMVFEPGDLEPAIEPAEPQPAQAEPAIEAQP